MTQSLAQMADRLAIGSTTGTQAPHAAQGNSGAGSRPHSSTLTYTSSSKISRPLFPSFQRAPSVATQQPIAQRKPTQEEDIIEHRMEYVSLGRDFHQDMNLVEYCGLRLRKEDNNHNKGITCISFIKLVKLLYLILTNPPNTLL
jgi:hypothetical protein